MRNLFKLNTPSFLHVTFFILTVLGSNTQFTFSQKSDNTGVVKDYAPVNGLRMYYEIYGTGQPLILLHGAYSAIGTSFGSLIPALSKSRQVIAVDLQGHGRTADIDRPITYEQLAEDIAGLMKYLKIKNADLFGYSLGSGVAIRLAIQHPDMVRKMVLTSLSYNTEGIYPEVWAGISYITPEVFEGTPWKKEYDSIAPNPKDFPRLVAKLKKLDETKYDWKADTIKAIKAPALIIIGDADIIRPEHAVEMLRLFGGGVIGDMAGLPDSQLAILPGTTHVTVVYKADWLLSMIPAFLDTPLIKVQ